MRAHRFALTLDCLEPRELLAGPVSPLDPVLPPKNNGGLNIIIITPIQPVDPLGPIMSERR
jgi:hypothetical protein